MKLHTLAALRGSALCATLCSALCLSCVSTPTPADQSSIPKAGTEAAPQASPTPAEQPSTVSPKSTEEAQALLDKAVAALDQNHLTEAIYAYVSVIAMAQSDGSSGLRALADKAQAELTRIGTRLSLEPATEWLDEKGSQRSGSTRSIGKDGAMQPIVHLYENFGTGKSPVADAPIYFEFARNGGTLTSFAATDAFGRANTVIVKLDAPGKDAVVRAYPVFKARGFAFAFKSLARDFTYLPPSNIARLVTLEKTEFGATDAAQAADAVAAALKPLGLLLSPVNGKILGDGFTQAFGGDASALASIGGEPPASYFVFVYTECEPARQLEVGGTKYNIYFSMTKATLRIVRDDGTIVFTLPLDGIKGQGPNPQGAVDSALSLARDALAKAIAANMTAISNALLKE